MHDAPRAYRAADSTFPAPDLHPSTGRLRALAAAGTARRVSRRQQRESRQNRSLTDVAEPGFPLPRGGPQCDCQWDVRRASWVSNKTNSPVHLSRRHASAVDGDSGGGGGSSAVGGGGGVCIVSIARGGNYQSGLGAALIQNKLAFCAACGYRCLLVNRTYETDRHPSWDKILALQDAMRSGACNLTMWVDADVVFLQAFAMQPLIRTEMAATREYGGLNGGVLFFRRTAAIETLLQLAWAEKRFEKPPGLEQTAIKYVLGQQWTSVHGRENAKLRSQVTMYDNFVRWVPAFWTHPVVKRNRTLRETAPLFHAAGCSLFPNSRSKQAMCRQLFRKYLGLADLTSGGCGRLHEEILRPRRISSGDTNIAYGQGRELIEKQRNRTIRRGLKKRASGRLGAADKLGPGATSGAQGTSRRGGRGTKARTRPKVAEAEQSVPAAATRSRPGPWAPIQETGT